MQTSNRLIYCKGSTSIKKAQFGGAIGAVAKGISGYQSINTFNPDDALSQGMSGIQKANIPAVKPGIGGGLMSAAGDMVSGVVGKLIAGKGKDPIQGAIDKGLDSTEIAQIEGTGSKEGVASGVIGGLGKVAGMIPGPWGQVAKIGLGAAESLFKRGQVNKQKLAAEELIAASTERTNDKAQMNALAQMGQQGGVLYKKPNRILSLVTGGIYKDGGKAPERLMWDHPFIISFPDTTMEKKVSIRVFKRGGKFNHPDKTNVVITGSRHHENNALGDKGLPVINKTGEKVFEVEKGELILTKEATNKIEDFLEKYKKVEVDEDKAHVVLKNLGLYFKNEIKENLYNYDKDVV